MRSSPETQPIGRIRERTDDGAYRAGLEHDRGVSEHDDVVARPGQAGVEGAGLAAARR